MDKKLGCAALLLAATIGGNAWADTLATLADSGVRETQTSVDIAFASGAGAGNASFTLYGSNTLDGDNFWIDILSLTLDGQTLLTGTWDLGGGGVDRVLDNPSGASITRVDLHNLSISTPLALGAGPHTLSFTYTSPIEFEGSGRAGFQGLGDEGWGVANLTITGVSPVPEPGPAALLAAGLAVLAVARRRG